MSPNGDDPGLNSALCGKMEVKDKCARFGVPVIELVTFALICTLFDLRALFLITRVGLGTVLLMRFDAYVF